MDKIGVLGKLSIITYSSKSNQDISFHEVPNGADSQPYFENIIRQAYYIFVIITNIELKKLISMAKSFKLNK